ncbi:MtnX-like HAD-IB family phosphatase [Labrys neptuniae]
MAYRIFCDFDGTIATSDVTDRLLEAFAAPGWHDIEDEWQAGLIGSAECMARQIELLRCSRPALDQLLDTVEIDPGFAGFVAFCREHDIELTVVSDGLDYAIARILVRAGLGQLPIVANHLVFLPDDHYAMLSPHASPACRTGAGTCKCRTVDSADLKGFGVPQSTVLIGDGRSDYCAAGAVDFVFAKDGLLGHCRDQDITHLPYQNFAEITALLSERLPGFEELAPARTRVLAGDADFLGHEAVAAAGIGAAELS